MQINYSWNSLIILLVFFLKKCICNPIRANKSECLNLDDCYDRKLHHVEMGPKFSCPYRPVRRENKNVNWLENGIKFAEKQFNQILNENIAINIIFFLGDGMSLTTLAATRVYIGGEEKSLSFEKFPFTGLVRTYSLDKMTPDSACTSTAYLTGVKANYGTIGVNGHVKRQDCKAMMDESKHTHSIGNWSLEAGKSVGFVTTTRVTHASPAGLYAHIADRNWEYDAEIKKHCDDSAKDIAYQLIHGSVGKKLKVILGGGRRNFCDENSQDDKRSCLRTDGKNLTEEWLNANKSEKRIFVENRKQLLDVDPEETDKLFGMFQDSHLLFHLEAEHLNRTYEQPTLEEMTVKAIEMLQTNNEKGFFLFVEGGKIDLAHHGVNAKLALDETAEFSKAIKRARDMTNEKDTLIVVSSDHSHTMTISGYPHRHQNVLSVAAMSKIDERHYHILNYAAGRGFSKYFDKKENKRVEPEELINNSPNKIFLPYPSVFIAKREMHSGEDVAVFASGPWAHFFTGAHEQYFLPYLMGYAACIGGGMTACDDD